MHRNSNTKVLLKNRSYLLLSLANIVNRFGDSVDSIVFTWLTYSLTESASFSALVYAANRLPTVILQPFAAAMVERRKKKPIMVLTDILRAVLVCYILLRLWQGALTAAELLVFTLLISTVEAFRQPAGGCMIPLIVEKELYTEAISYSTGISSAAELAGLGAGALIIGAVGNEGAILIDVMTFIISAALLSLLRLDEKITAGGGFHAKEIIADLKDGISVIKKSSVMKYLIALALILNALLSPWSSLEAATVQEILHSGEAMLGLMGICFSLSCIVGSMLYPAVSKRLSMRAILLLGSIMVGGFYILTVAAGQIRSPILVYVAEAVIVFIFGLNIAFINACVSVEIISKCDQNYLARISGVMNSLGGAATPLMALLVSAAARVIPLAALFIVCGILAFLACMLMFSRRVMPKELQREGK